MSNRDRIRIRMRPLTLWTLGIVCQALLLAGVLIGLLYLLVALAGCASSGPEPVYDPLPAEKARPVLPPLVYPPDPPPVKVPQNNRAQLAPTRAPTNQPPAKHLLLAWDWVPDSGPVWFEVWHATNNLNGFAWLGGTNVPAGFTLLTNAPSSPIDLRGDQAAEFFMVRAANQVGVSDWATR